MSSTYRYLVKYTAPDGAVILGIIRTFGPEVERHRKDGNAIVDDAVLPKAHLVPEKDLVDIKPKFGHVVDRMTGAMEGQDEVHQAQTDALLKAQRLSASLPDDGELHEGALFNIGVGDGYAWYVVTKVNKKTCRVEWRRFQGDGYQDHHFQLGGTFPKADVLRYTTRARAFSRMFSRDTATRDTATV